MGLVHGNEGSVAIGSDRVAKVTDFQLNIEVPTSDVTAMGDAWEDHIGGAAKGWGGTLNVKRVTADPGQTALIAGAEVTLHLYGDGDAIGKAYYSGLAVITKVGRSQNAKEAVDMSFDFKGRGELTTPTKA